MKIINFKKDNDIFDNVIEMVKENYFINDENVILVIAYNISKISFYDFKNKYKNKKIIVYQLEQLYNNLSNWYNKESEDVLTKNRTRNTIDWLSGCDEIWDYDLNNIQFLKKEGFSNIEFKPLLYTPSLLNINNNLNKDIDILFYGRINKRRAEFFYKIKEKFQLKIYGVYSFLSDYEKDFYNLKINSKIHGDDLKGLISRSKVIICPHYYESKIQEQVRIFYLLINNKCVLVEESKTNYYQSLIEEFNSDNLLEKVDFLINKNGYKNYENVSEKFKNKKWNIKY